MLSTHKVEVVRVKLRPHPNADTLSIVDVFDGFPCIVRTSDWKDGDLAAYIPPDSVVDVTRPEFAWLGGGTKTRHHVKTVKLRGALSYGLLMPAPPGAELGDDVSEIYGVVHYEPEMHLGTKEGEAILAPVLLRSVPKYDIDALRRHRHVFEPGEPVVVTEKIHGANSRYSCHAGEMWCGSRGEWKKKDVLNLYWRALTPEMEAFCQSSPGTILYGEVYGQVQDLHYGLKNRVAFRAFDVLDTSLGEYLPEHCMRDMLTAIGVPVVPLLEEMPFDFDAVCELAEGPSTVPGADHVREGCVVRPVKERWHQTIGRVILKVVGSGYLDR